MLFYTSIFNQNFNVYQTQINTYIRTFNLLYVLPNYFIRSDHLNIFGEKYIEIVIPVPDCMNLKVTRSLFKCPVSNLLKNSL